MIIIFFFLVGWLGRTCQAQPCSRTSVNGQRQQVAVTCAINRLSWRFFFLVFFSSLFIPSSPGTAHFVSYPMFDIENREPILKLTDVIKAFFIGTNDVCSPSVSGRISVLKKSRDTLSVHADCYDCCIFKVRPKNFCTYQYFVNCSTN